MLPEGFHRFRCHYGLLAGGVKVENLALAGKLLYVIPPAPTLDQLLDVAPFWTRVLGPRAAHFRASGFGLWPVGLDAPTVGLELIA